jgi:hypothetical protein
MSTKKPSIEDLPEADKAAAEKEEAKDETAKEGEELKEDELDAVAGGVSIAQTLEKKAGIPKLGGDLTHVKIPLGKQGGVFGPRG